MSTSILGTDKQYAKNAYTHNGPYTNHIMSHNGQIEKKRNHLGNGNEKKQYFRTLLQITVLSLVNVVCEHYQII